MREIFTDLFANEPLDPNEAVRRSMRPSLPRRFYRTATVEKRDRQFAIELDGRPARTPARRSLAAPSHKLADAIADEWRAQPQHIDPATMPLTRLANTIIDGVAEKPDPVAAEVAKYLESDLVCYRAAGPDRLIESEARHWDPLVAWAAEALDARFLTAAGISAIAQPPVALANARAVIPHDPWRLGAVHTITTLTGSALIALAVLRGRLGVDEAWAVAHVDEDWNMEAWGRDEAALARRTFRFAEMQAAATVLSGLG